MYVGISLNAIKRMVDHRSQSKEWFDEIAFTAKKTYPSRAEAEKAEAIAIRNENPKWNKDRPLGTASQDVDPIKNLDQFRENLSTDNIVKSLLEQAGYVKDQGDADLVNLLRNKVIGQGNSISFLHAEIKKLEAVGVKSEPTDNWKKALWDIRDQLRSLEKDFRKHEDLYNGNQDINAENWGFLMKSLGFEWHGQMPDGYWKHTKGGLLDSCMRMENGEILAEQISDLRKEFETHMGHKEFGKKDSDSIPMFKRIQNQGAVESAMMTHLSKLTEHLGLEWDREDQSLKKKKLPKGGKNALSEAV